MEEEAKDHESSQGGAAEASARPAQLGASGAGSQTPQDGDAQPGPPGPRWPELRVGPTHQPPDTVDVELLDEGPVVAPEELRAILETLVFTSPEPVTQRELGKVLAGVPKDTWLAALDGLKADYAQPGRGLQLIEVAGGYQITTRPEYNDWVRELLDPQKPTRLSIQALETLAVIAYKQPVTLPEIIDLRGVKSGGVVKTLLEKHLIKITGRKEVVGRPMLYGTTKEFLLHFGLKDLAELPKVEEFAEVLGEEVDVAGLKKAIEAPRPTETALAEDSTIYPDKTDSYDPDLK